MSHAPSLEISSEKQSESSLLKKVVLNGIKFGITFGILYWLYQRGMLDFTRVKAVLSDVPVMVTCFLLILSTNLAAVVRWYLLLQGQGLKVSLLESLKLTMIGVFFNTALPGAVSGDVVKGFYVVRQQPDGRGKIRAFTTLLLDRLLGLSALVCVSFVAMALNLDTMLGSKTLKSLAGFITLMWVGVLAFYAFVLVEWSFSKKLIKLLSKLPAGEYFVKLYEAVKAYENSRHYVIKGLLISIGIHCVIVSVFLYISSSLGGFESVPADKFFFLVPLGLLVTAIPIAPAGLGTGHAAFAWLFQQIGMKSGADLFTIFVTFQLLMSLIGGVFYMRYRGHAPAAR